MNPLQFNEHLEADALSPPSSARSAHSTTSSSSSYRHNPYQLCDFVLMKHNSDGSFDASTSSGVQVEHVSAASSAAAFATSQSFPSSSMSKSPCSDTENTPPANRYRHRLRTQTEPFDAIGDTEPIIADDCVLPLPPPPPHASHVLPPPEHHELHDPSEPVPLNAPIEKDSGVPFSSAYLEGLLAMPPSAGRDDDAAMCPGGGAFSVYDGDFVMHFSIPSDNVEVTQGAVKYVSYLEKYGGLVRFRFQLCKRHSSGKCTKGRQCPYIHSRALQQCTQVHTNENIVMSHTPLTPEVIAGGNNSLGYETLPAGVTIAVYAPNNSQYAPQIIPSECILKTAGSSNVYSTVSALQWHALQSQQMYPPPGGNLQPDNVKPRHCAHFQFKRMCNLGKSCNFIHSLVPFVQSLAKPAVGDDAHARAPRPYQATPFPTHQPPRAQPTSQQPPMRSAGSSFTPQPHMPPGPPMVFWPPTYPPPGGYVVLPTPYQQQQTQPMLQHQQQQQQPRRYTNQ